MPSTAIKHGPVTPVRFLKLSATPIAPPVAPVAPAPTPAPSEPPLPTTFDEAFDKLIKPSRPAGVQVRKATPVPAVVRIPHLNRYSQGHWG